MINRKEFKYRPTKDKKGGFVCPPFSFLINIPIFLILSSTMEKEKKKPKRRRNNSVPLFYPDQIDFLPTFTPDNTFFTADTHFYSTGIIKHRPRFPDVETMNETLIRNWNETVPEDGVVFHLGDFCSEVPKEKVLELIGRLHGTILLINGNHDDIGLYRSKRFQERRCITVPN